MVTEPTISIAMATFNGALYLEEQLESLANQTKAPTELIVTDDGSNDATVDILKYFARHSPFHVCIEQNNVRLGYRANFMKAASLCRSQLISFCDQDDIWDRDNLAKISACFDDDEVLLAYHNTRLIDASGADRGLFYVDPPGPHRAPHLTLRPWSFSYGLTQTFRASLLLTSDEWPNLLDFNRAGEPIAHDLFYFLLASSLGTVAYIHEPLISYRQHASNTWGAGARSRPGMIARWRYRLEDRSQTYQYLSSLAEIYAHMFERLVNNELFDDKLRARAPKAADAWQKLVPMYSSRASVCSGSFPKRAKAFFRLWQQESYSETGYWTYGRKAALKDAVLGVALAPLVQRYGVMSSSTDPSCRRGRLHIQN